MAELRLRGGHARKGGRGPKGHTGEGHTWGRHTGGGHAREGGSGPASAPCCTAARLPWGRARPLRRRTRLKSRPRRRLKSRSRAAARCVGSAACPGGVCWLHGKAAGEMVEHGLYSLPCSSLLCSCRGTEDKIRAFSSTKKQQFSMVSVFFFFSSEYVVQLIPRNFSRAVKVSQTVGAFVELNLIFFFST